MTTDDLLCRACEVQNTVELNQIKFRRDIQDNDVLLMLRIIRLLNFHDLSHHRLILSSRLELVSVVLPLRSFSTNYVYVYFYRSRSTAENIKKVLLHFYSSQNISAAKKEIASHC